MWLEAAIWDHQLVDGVERMTWVECVEREEQRPRTQGSGSSRKQAREGPRAPSCPLLEALKLLNPRQPAHTCGPLTTRG